MPQISKLVKKIERSGIEVIRDMAREITGVCKLEIGEPIDNTPDHIIEAAYKAAKEGYTKYASANGFLSLREAIAKRLNDDYNLHVKPNNVVVTVGGIGAISSAVRALTDPGDEVLIPDPGWPNYESVVRCAGAIPRRYRLFPEWGFLPDISELENSLTPQSKVLILNSPSNPLGVVTPPDLTEELVKFARENDIFIISDEVYEKIVFEGEHKSTLFFDKDDRVVGAFSFSKTYAMTGWRIGYAVASKDIAAEITKVQDAYVSNTCSVSQKAAEAALSGPQQCIEKMKKGYYENLKTAMNLLDKYDINYQKPQGAFYVYIDTNCKNSIDFAKKLLLEKKVSVAPGKAFSDFGDSYIRISLSSSKEDVEDGVKRLCEFIKENK